MNIVDLSHLLSTDTQPYPGTPEPAISDFATIIKDGYREKLLQITSHLATHMDAPAHILPEGRTLDSFPAQSFYGRAFVVDAFCKQAAEIPLSVLKQLPEEPLDFILLRTGWSEKWGDAAYFSSFPYLSQELTAALLKKNLKGVGLDAPSADSRTSETFPAHHLLLKSEVLIIENLCCLDKILQKTFTFAGFPLKIKQADGSPVRAVAILDGETVR